MPSTLGNCSTMITMDLSYNRLHGNIAWESILQMKGSLSSLNLSDNLFSGELSMQIGVLHFLEELDVSSNDLTGPIPQSLVSLPFLKFFNASFNDFEGDARSLAGRFSRSSFLGNPRLCGAILGPQQECSTKVGSPSCQGFKCDHIWIPTICSVLVVSIVSVVEWLLYRRHWKSINSENGYSNRHLLLNFVPPSHPGFVESDVLKAMRGGIDNVTGTGANSVVYKSSLSTGETFVVKASFKPGGRVNVDYGSRQNELQAEVRILTKLRHRNILKVLAYYSTSDITAAILEYMPNGSLHQHLHPVEVLETDTRQFRWSVRLDVAVGVAQAMAYLHHDFPEPIIHGDLKPNNILLDADFVPKVGDFGISKFVNPNRKLSGEASASTICGTIGFMPPEYAMESRVSTRGDVYSYGMILLEMVTGKSPICEGNEVGNGGLREWVMQLFHERPVELIHSTLLHNEGVANGAMSIKDEQMIILLEVALLCTKGNPQSRPSMNDVIPMLKQIKEIGSNRARPTAIQQLAKDWTAQYPNDPQLPSASPKLFALTGAANETS